MPLVEGALGQQIHDELVVAFGPPQDDTYLTKFSNAVGKAVVEYIKANALVVGTVTTGGGAGGDVTGTVT